MTKRYIILHHVCRCMSQQQRNSYMKSVERGTHRDQLEYGEENNIDTEQALPENAPNKDTDHPDIESQLAGAMQVARDTHVYGSTIKVAGQRKREGK